MTGLAPRMSAPLLAAALVVGGAAACSSSGDNAATTTTSEATTTTAPASTTTAPPATTTTAGSPGTTSTTASGGGPVTPTDPQAYATAFVDAWVVGDHNTALALGTQEAVDSIFAFESGGADVGWALIDCEGAAGSSFCTFNAGGDPTVIVQVGNEAASQGQLHAVTSVQVQS